MHFELNSLRYLAKQAAVDFEILEGMPFALIEKLEFHT